MSLNIRMETKLESDPCVIAWDNKLFVGTEHGSIKSFDEKLLPKDSWVAHSVQLFALAAGGGRVYSASNDGGVKVWSSVGNKIAELASTGADVGALHVFDKSVYAGDEDGNITVYENNVQIAKYNVLEEVKDLWLNPPFLYSARNLDVTVTEIKPEESKTRFMTRHTMEGRTPLLVTNNRLLFMARGGNCLRLHDATAESNFKMLDEVKISDMIITSMSASGNCVWTGGWDGNIKKWDITGDKLQAAGYINVGSCVNALVATADCVYAGIAGGRVVCVADDDGKSNVVLFCELE